MNVRRSLLTFAFVLPALLWAAPPAGTVLIHGRPAHPTRVIAKARSGLDLQRAQELATQQAPVTRARGLGGVSGLLLFDLESPAVARAVVGAGEPTRRLQLALDNLRASGQFEYVEPDYVLNLTALTDEPAYADGRLWGLRNRGTPGLAGVDVDVDRAWALTSGSAQVVVAVLDSGLRTSHQDLRDNLWINPGEIPGNGRDDDGNGYVDDVHGADMTDPSKALSDDNGHGTHVAGTIAATAGNSGPHVGVAPGVRIMGIRASDEAARFSTSAIIDGFGYAVRHGAKVVNASFGGPTYSQAQYDALDHARAAGLLIVCAAGNDGQNNDLGGAFPAGYRLPNVLSIAAMDRFGALAEFSNYGVETVHLAAPGVEIFSCSNAGDETYATMQGTSMAAPHVTGVAALVWSRFPQATATEVRQRLLQSVVPLPSLAAKVQTGGMVNAFRALALDPDEHMEFELRPRNSPYLVSGQENIVDVSLSDVEVIVGGTVAQSVGGIAGTLLNDLGTPPDLHPGDGVFSGTITPAGAGEQLLDLATTWNAKAVHIQRQVLVQSRASNDQASDSTLLPFNRGQIHGKTYGATKEWFEPNFASAGSTVWYSFTVNQLGDYRVQAISRDFQPTVRVYDIGPAGLPNLIGVGSFGVIVPPRPIGTTVLVAVESSNGRQGEFDLSLDDSPMSVNDNVADAILLPGKHFLSASADNRFATKEGGEPDHAGNAGGHSVWWRYVPPVTGRLVISTRGSSFDTLLAVYDQQYQQLAANDDATGTTELPLRTSQVELPATQGQAIWIALDGYGGGTGTVRLSLRLMPNNNFYPGAAELTSGAAQLASNSGANKGAGEPNHAGDPGGASVWFRWTAPTGGRTTVSVAPLTSGFNPLLAAYVGPEDITVAADWQQVAYVAAAGDFSVGGGQTVAVTFDAVAGRPYRFVVDGRWEGFRFPSANIGSFTIGVATDSKTGRIYQTDFEAAANQPNFFPTLSSSRAENIGVGWQISGNTSLLLTPSPEPDTTSSWYYDNVFSLERGRSEFSCRFREVNANADSGWVIAFLIMPVSYSLDSIGPNSQMAGFGFAEGGNDSALLVGTANAAKTNPVPSLSPGMVHHLKLTLDAASERLQLVLDGSVTAELPVSFIGQKNLAVGPAFVFRGKPVGGILPQLIIDDLDLNVAPRRVAPQMAAVHSGGPTLQLRVMGDPFDEMRLEESRDLNEWTPGQLILLPASGDGYFDIGLPPMPAWFIRGSAE
jgi:hypothetical protein